LPAAYLAKLNTEQRRAVEHGGESHDEAPPLLIIAGAGSGKTNMEKRFPAKGTCLAIYSRTVNAEVALDEVLGSSFPWCTGWEAELRKLFAAYVEAKQRQHVLDYDDLLLYWAQMMGEPSLAADVSARFDHVLVDEYQDTNRLQASILLALKPNGRGLTVVGTTRNPSTRFEPRRYAIFSTSPGISALAPRSLRLSRTTVPRSRSSRLQTP
jgi:superfamily I DNA/RNA helicase